MNSLAYLTKLSRPMVAALGLLCLPALSQAQHTIFDGSSLDHFFGNTVPTHDTTQGSPNSAVSQSAHFEMGAWAHSSFGLTSRTAAPAAVNNWAGPGGISFDYKVNGATSDIYTVQLHFWNGSGANRQVAGAMYDGGTDLVSDGEWHTFTAEIDDWTDTYYDEIAAGTWDATEAIQWRVRFQAGGKGLNDVNIDNITVIPEPGTYAAIFGVSFLGLALWIRRRRQA